jgi:AcrR family transcriptional regulator
MGCMKDGAGRPYRMTARARAAERTGERIIDVMLELFAEMPYDRIRLEDVASRAGVTVQTVIRRFGTKHGLLAATVERELSRLGADRAAAMEDSPEQTLHSLIRYYEKYGELILKLYAEAAQAPGVPELAARSRRYHVSWCREAFAGHLADADGQATRNRRLAQVVALCDATTWRILRFDGGLSVKQTEEALREMLLPLLGPTQPRHQGKR